MADASGATSSASGSLGITGIILAPVVLSFIKVQASKFEVADSLEPDHEARQFKRPASKGIQPRRRRRPGATASRAELRPPRTPGEAATTGRSATPARR